MVRSFGRRGRLLVLVGGLITALAVPVGVNADTTAEVPSIQPAISRDATIQIMSVSSTAKVVVNVSIEFTCQPFQVYDWNTGETIEATAGSLEGGQVTILQAQGRTIAWGRSDIFGGPVTCDGSTVTRVTIPVSAAVSPWKSGAAVIGATVFVSDATAFQDSDYASTGPVAVKLGR